FKILYGQAINRPSFFMNIDLLDFGGAPLKPETIQTIELNYIGQLSPKFSVSFSLFRNMLDQLIYRSQFFVGGTYINYFANVGEMTTNGLELTLTARPSQKLHLEFSATYQDTKDNRPSAGGINYGDIEVGYSPNFLGYVKAAFSFNKDISLAVTGNYVGAMESYYDDTIGARLGDKVDSYFLLGANLRFRNLFGKGFYLNIRGSNLLDQEFFYPTTANNAWATKGFLGRGLSFLVTLGYKFK
ncbi:MAG: TonB-dependent receptor, partial [bacterium]|nr:TonB-dependent receptor [bacterium]